MVDASSPGDLPLHPVLAEVMSQARELAAVHGDEGTISTDHVLLALLTRTETLRTELQPFGFDHERLQASIVGTSSPLVLDEPLLLDQPTEEVDTARILDASANRLGGTGAGNGNFTGQSYTIDKAAPSVTINQATGQADPTSTSPINFTVTFSETATGFTASDISFAGSTVGARSRR